MDRVVVVGAAGGGAEALETIVRALCGGFPAAIVAVVHERPGAGSRLSQRLPQRTALAVSDAEDGEPLEPGRLYAAVPDHHLVIDAGRVGVRHGARDNGFRPSVDVLFRSAACAWGARAVGVVLSGALADGAAGLHAIKAMGGVAIVQDPADAAFSSMPVHALRQTPVDHVAAAGAIARLLEDTVRAAPPPEREDARALRERLRADLAVLFGDARWRPHLGGVTASVRACPACRGRMLDGLAAGPHARHAREHEAEGLPPVQAPEPPEDRLRNAARALEDAAALMHETAEALERAGAAKAARDMRSKLDEVQRRLAALRVLAHTGGEAHRARAGTVREARRVRTNGS